MGTGAQPSIRVRSRRGAVLDSPRVDALKLRFDDNGTELAAERDPWEEEEDSGNTAFLPVVEGKR